MHPIQWLTPVVEEEVVEKEKPQASLGSYRVEEIELE